MRHNIRSRPLFTTIYESPIKFCPCAGSVYIYGVFEERSEHLLLWSKKSHNVTFVKVLEESRPIFSSDFSSKKFSMRNRSEVEDFINKLPPGTIYLDITGLSHHIWAPLLRVAIEQSRIIEVVYVEPSDYKYSATPVDGSIFDLSERIEGIAPIPLFTTLIDPDEDKICLIPLLGFEGARFSFLMENVEAPGGNVIPVVGVPGFRAEYPFHTYHGNSFRLSQSRAWRSVHYARANCPFSLFYTLQDIFSGFPDHHFKIAPIGTKPHALGAVLVSLGQCRPVELVYDHPKRKGGRTSGSLRCLVYAVSRFLSGNPSANPGIAQ